jgi:hypothetical protein
MPADMSTDLRCAASYRVSGEEERLCLRPFVKNYTALFHAFMNFM